jgi:glyoxylase-like metal-dependent hydrolase (beta-lactamase superfamily II)
MKIKIIRTFEGDVEESKKIGINCSPYSISSYLLDNGEDVVLIDTSFPDDFTKMPGALQFGVGVGNRISTFKNAINESGYNMEDITKIVLTHNHIDHAGVIDQFPNAKIYINEKDYAGLSCKTENIIKVNLTKNPMFNFKGSFTVSKGIYMLPAEGHSEGHSIVITKTDEEELYYMFCGDVVGTIEDLKESRYFPLTISEESSIESMKDVTQFIKEHKTVVIPVHEQNVELVLQNKTILELR